MRFEAVRIHCGVAAADNLCALTLAQKHSVAALS